VSGSRKSGKILYSEETSGVSPNSPTEAGEPIDCGGATIDVESAQITGSSCAIKQAAAFNFQMSSKQKAEFESETLLKSNKTTNSAFAYNTNDAQRINQEESSTSSFFIQP